MTLPLAIAGLIAVGSSWCLVGIIMGYAPKIGIPANCVQLASCVGSLVVSLVLSIISVSGAQCTPHVLVATCLVYFIAGFLNYWGVMAMAAGMQRGPNGVVWGIMQSALIFQFAAGILFFNVAPTTPRMLGIASIAVALVFYSMTKSNAPGAVKDGHSWKFFAFLSFAAIAFQQNFATLPSYYQECRLVPAAARVFSSALGGMAGTLVTLAIEFAKARDRAMQDLRGLSRGKLWLFVAGMQLFGLVFSYMLLYPGLDVLGKEGAGSVSYPIMVGSCILAFSLYAAISLKEKVTAKQVLALVFCAIGLVGLCSRSHEASARSYVALLCKTVNQYESDNETLPTGLQALLDSKLLPKLRKDPWDNDYAYLVPGRHEGEKFEVLSLGADGVLGGEGENADISSHDIDDLDQVKETTAPSPLRDAIHRLLVGK